MAYKKPGLDNEECLEIAGKMSNLLFICSKNQWRSPTAEKLFKNHQIHEARSAGTSDKARIKVNRKLIEWADVIFVMERKHLDMIKQRFSSAVADKEIIVLEIEDNYPLDDAALIGILKDALFGYL